MKDTLTDVILSIKPVFADEILSGAKKVEFRRKVFKRKVDKVYIYSSMPKKMIVGYFTFKRIDEDTPKNLWEKYKNISGINKTDFFAYFTGCEKGYSIIIDEVNKFQIEVDPVNVIKNFSPPQSYIYLKKNEINPIVY